MGHERYRSLDDIVLDRPVDDWRGACSSTAASTACT